MDVIIAAGGVPQPDDPMYAYTQGKPKALIEMHGRTMLERVVDGLQDSRYVDDIVVVGLGSDMGQTFKRPVHHLPDRGSLVKNGLAGAQYWLERKPESRRFILCTADIPLLTGRLVDQFMEMCQPYEKGIYYIMVTREAMEQRFPHSNRTFVKLKGREIAGGDLGIMDVKLMDSEETLDMVANARKHAWKIARIAGLRILLKLLFRQLDITDIEQTGQRIVGIPVKIILDPPAELAMDGDKPDQIDLLREELARLAQRDDAVTE